ncbi:polyphosphate glucokinase [Arthrobacter alpinus]|uniref:polyphosphate--glucose phosphotransferase n=1 Tax=Arthrobacter alpinus TaxID=656366 RepID=UPI0005CA0BE9|nr:ROK family protein [Arthrobacter alpinus]ALV44636.1 polyphosphate glucokinase [Arthrobacter alpinus]
MEPTTCEALHLGIDIGGTAIKYGVVDTATGNLASPIAQLPTPNPATPDAVAGALRKLLAEVERWDAALPPDAAAGVAFPAIMRHGTAHSAANISDEWIGMDVNELLGQALGRPVNTINDADAAGLAEASRGAGRGQDGTVLVLTLGTGIGSALVVDGALVPNLELGHLEMGGEKAEARASAVARQRDGLDWTGYAARLQEYLAHVEFLFSPELVILGGGISVRHEEFLPHLSLRTPVVPAQLHNSAGVVGAALAAA